MNKCNECNHTFEQKENPLTEGQKFIQIEELGRCPAGAAGICSWHDSNCEKCKRIQVQAIDMYLASKPKDEPEPEETEFQKWFRGYLKDKYPDSDYYEQSWAEIERCWPGILEQSRSAWNAMADLACKSADGKHSSKDIRNEIQSLKVKESNHE